MSGPQQPYRSDVATLLEDAPHVDDAGFTARTVGALPPQRPRGVMAYGLVPALAVVACGLGWVAAGRTLGARALLPQSIFSMAATSSMAAMACAIALVGLGVVLAGED